MLNVRHDCDSINVDTAFKLFSHENVYLLKKLHIYTPKRILMQSYAMIVGHNTVLSKNPQIKASANKQAVLEKKIQRHTIILACRKVIQYRESEICKKWLVNQFIVKETDDRLTQFNKIEAERKGLEYSIGTIITQSEKVSNTKSKKVTYYDYLKEMQILQKNGYKVSLKMSYSEYIMAQNLFYDECEQNRKQIEEQKNGRTRNHR